MLILEKLSECVLWDRGGRVRIKKYLEMLTQGKYQCKA